MVVLASSEGCCCSEAAAVVAVYTTRAKAQTIIDEWDAAVRRAVADGVHGICHEGDFEIADLETDPEGAISFIDKYLYLWKYLNERP